MAATLVAGRITQAPLRFSHMRSRSPAMLCKSATSLSHPSSMPLSACSLRRTSHTTTASRRQGIKCSASNDGAFEELGRIAYDHLMLAILDSNPCLSDGSKQAVAATAGLAFKHQSKVTVLLVDKDKPGEDAAKRLDTISWYFREKGCNDFEVLDQINPPSWAVAVGDVADEVDADLLVMSSEAVHSKAVDANLLAEFVPCPMLLLP